MAVSWLYNMEEIKLQLKPHGSGAMFYISSTLLRYKFLQLNKTYNIKIDEVKT